MKLLILASMLLASQVSFAQDESVSVGLGGGQLFNSEAGSIGVNFDYKDGTGFYLPISAQIGSDVRKLTAGLGYSTDDTRSLMAYSIAGALAHLKFDEDFKDVLEKDRNRFTLLLQQELSFQLSSRLQLGVHFDLDLFNWSRKLTAQEAGNAEVYLAKGAATDGVDWWKDGKLIIAPEYQTQAEQDAAINSVSKSGASSAGLSLKIRLGN